MIKNTVILLLLSSLCNFSIAAESKEKEQENQESHVFDCDHDSMEWMRNCKAVNKELSQPKTEGVRVKTVNDVDMYFAPGTPPSLIKVMVLQTPQAAKEHADWEEKEQAIRENTARLMMAEYKRRGKNLAPPTDGELLKSAGRHVINYDDVVLYYFYATNCPYCRETFPVLQALQEKHRALKVAYLQIDNNWNAKSKIENKYRITARILTKAERRKYGKKITRTPTFWFQSKKSKRNVLQQGKLNLDEIEKQLAILSEDTSLARK